MKVFILKEEDFQQLLCMIDRNPEHGRNGGSSVILNDIEKQYYDDAHRFYNYQVRKWLDMVQK